MSEQKLRLTLHATALKNVAGAFKGRSDPYAEVKLVASGSDEDPGILLGRTESIKNSLSPKWTTSFLFDYNPETEKEAYIKVLVADKIRKESDKLIGSFVFKIDILLSKGSMEGKLFESDNVEEQGRMRLYARIREVPPILAGKLILRWQGYRDKSDPWFVLLRTYDDGDGEVAPIYRSERVKSWIPSESPEWSPAIIDLHALCDGDLNRSFHLVVFDHDMTPDADHVQLGAFRTTVNELIEKNKGKPYKLTKGSEPCGTISLDECEMTEAEADTLSMTNPVDKLQLTLHASGLKNVAGVGKGISDPYAEVKLIASGSNEEQGKLLGRTEVIKNSLSPEWTTSFIFDHSFGKEACIKVSVVDKVRKGSGIPMGSAVFKIEDILGKQHQGGMEAKPLAIKKIGKQSTLSARIQKVPPKSAGKLIMRWQEFRGKSDPFFEVRRTYDEGKTWAPVYRSDRVKSNWSPQWNPATIDINALCDGDLNSKIQLAVHDYDKKGKHVHLRTFETTVNELIKSGKGDPFTLLKGSEASETIFVDECKILHNSVSDDTSQGKKLILLMQGEDLRNVEGQFRKSDPFFEVRRTYDDGKTWTLVYTSEYVEDNHTNPKWEVATIDINVLCAGDLNTKIKLALFDYERDGKHQAMGAFFTTVKELIESDGRELIQSAKGGYNNWKVSPTAHGRLFVHECKIIGTDPKPNPTKPPSPTPTPRPTPTPPPKPVDPTPHPTPPPEPNLPEPPIEPTPPPTPGPSDPQDFPSKYEEMIRHQNCEYNFTSKYLRFVFSRVQHLGRINSEIFAPQVETGHEEMLTWIQIRQCLLRIGISWNQSLPALINDDSNVNSPSSSTGISIHTGVMKPYIISLDLQLIMLLTMLVDAEEHYRTAKVTGKNDEDDAGRHGIYFTEFVQCYQLIVVGMQSLQALEVDEDVMKTQIENRMKERTFELVRAFGPDADRLCKRGTKEEEADAASDGLLPSSERSELSANAKDTPESNDSNGRMDADDIESHIQAKIKSLIQSNDSRLAALTQELEKEKDALAKDIDSLQSELAASLKSMKLMRFLCVSATILCVGVLTRIVPRELQRRVDAADSIAVLGEAERKAIVSSLNEQRDELRKKVGNAEKSIKYLAKRSGGIDASAKELEAKIEHIETKYLNEVAEFQLCGAQEKELSKLLTEDSAKKKKMDEELGGCESRLRETKKELKSLEQASTDLDMKFNNSTRHAVFLRQAYSAAAGLVVATAIGQLSPLAIKFFTPKPLVLPPPPVIRRRLFPWRWWRRGMLAMALVDGVFGGKIIFFVIRAIAFLGGP